jgi:hypothetical protein
MNVQAQDSLQIGSTSKVEDAATTKDASSIDTILLNRSN